MPPNSRNWVLLVLWCFTVGVPTCVRAQNTNPCNFSVSLNRPPPACDAVTFTPAGLDYVARGNYDQLCWIFSAGERIDTLCTEDFGTYTFTESGTITLEVSSSCKTLRRRVSVTVTPSRTLTLTAARQYCRGSDPVQLGTSLPGGTWSGEGIIDPRRGLFDPGTVPVGSSEIVYTYVEDACSYFDRIEVQVVASQEVIAQDTTVCEDAAPFPLSVNVSGGTWSGPGVTDAALGTFSTRGLRPGAYRPQYTYEDPEGCSVVARPTVLVQAYPRISLGDTTRVCWKDTVVDLRALTAGKFTPSDGDLRWYVDGKQVDVGRLNPASELPGTGDYVLRADYQLGECMTSRTTVLSVRPQPTVRLNPTEAQCASVGRYTLNANLAGGIFSGPGVNASTGVVDLRQVGPGTYSYSYTVDAGTTCAQTATTELTVLAAPDEADAGPDIVVCAGTQRFVPLAGATPAGGSYTGPGLSGASTVDLEQLAPNNTYQYTYRVGGEGGCSSTAVRELRYVAAPVADFTAPDKVCAGVAFEVTAQGEAARYTYDFGDGQTATTANPQQQYGYGDTTYTVELVVRTAAGCSDTSRQQIQVTASPEAGFLLDEETGCAPFTVAPLDRSRFAQEVYYLVGVDTVRGAAAEFTLPAGRRDSSVLLTQVVANGCGTDRSTATLHVRRPPRAGLAVDRSLGCSPFRPQLTNTSAGGALAYRFDYGNGTSSTGRMPEVPVYTNTGDTVARYTISVYSENDCGIDTLSRTVEVLPSDVRAAITLGEEQGCVPLLLRPSSSSTPGAILRWELLSEGGEALAQAVGEDPAFGIDAPGSYRLVLQASGCGQHTDTVGVEAFPAPELDIIAPARVCVDEPIELSAVGDTTAALHWAWADSGFSTLTRPTIRFDQPGPWQVTLTATPTAHNHCGAEITKTIEVLPPPVVTAGVVDSIGCTPFVARFSSGTAEPATLSYTWDFGDGSVPGLLAAPVHEYPTAGRYRPQVTVTDADGCTQTTAIGTVTVRTPPVADFMALTDVDPVAVGDVQFRNRSVDADEFLWSFGDSTRSSSVEPLHVYRADGPYAVTLTAITLYPGGAVCSDSITQLVQTESFGRFFVPSALSPDNGSGEVRNWGAKGLGVAAYELAVYSIYGQRVWETSAVSEGIPTGRWDGTYHNAGDPVPQGSYTWQATVTYADGRRENLVGTVTVVR